MTLSAVVVAAGAAQRMGRSKAALLWRGQSFLAHSVGQARAVAPRQLVVVEGAHPLGLLLEGMADTADIQHICHPEWPQGPLSSLQAGLRQLRPVTSVLVITVDRPCVSHGTLRQLEAARRAQPEFIWQPRYAGRSGHPLMYPWAFVEDLLKLSPEDSPRTLLRAQTGRWPQARRFVEVEDLAVLDNFDTPESLAKLPA